MNAPAQTRSGQPLFRALLVMVVAAFVIGLALGYQHLRRVEDMVSQKVSRSGWIATQTEVELVRFLEALSSYSAGTGDVYHYDVIERFEILWSRVPLLVTGDEAAVLRQIPGVEQTASELLAALESNEDAVYGLTDRDPRAAGAIRAALWPFIARTHDITVRAELRYETVASERSDERARALWLVRGLFGGVLLSGGLLVAFVVRESRRAARRLRETTAAQRAAREEQARLRDFAESASDWFWETDAEHRYRYLSDGYTERTGIPIETVLGLTRHETLGVIDMHDEPAWKRVIELSERHEDYRDLDLPVTRPNGEVRVFRSSGKAIFDEHGRFQGHRGMGSDVTDTVAAERTLELYEHIVSSTADLMVYADLELRAQAVNARYLEYHGTRREDVIGQSLTTYQSNEQFRRTFEPRLLRCLAGEEVRFEEWVEYRAAGERYMVIHYHPYRDASGRIVGIVGTASDATERKRAETERERLEHVVVQSQKMHALGELTGGIAHDFNNILASVLGYADLADTRPVAAGDPALRRYIEEIRAAGTRARDIVTQLLSFSRRGPSAPRTVDLRETMEAAIRMLRPMISSSVDINVVDDGAAGIVTVDPLQFEQAIVNLCINARDAMRDRGELEIALRETEVAAVRCSSCHEQFSGPRVELSVRDSGSGIDPDTLEHIFEPFYSSKAVGQGSGMGLAMVHGVAHQHAGHVVVESRPGEGTVFRLLLPRATRARDPAPAPAPVRRPHARRTDANRVLVVDDEPAVARYVGELLETAGLEATVVCDAPQALATFAADPRRYDLLVTDVTMPGLAGTELAERVRALRPDLPVILCTGYGIDGIPRNLPGAAVLSKPLESDTLLDVVDALLPGEPPDPGGRRDYSVA